MSASYEALLVFLAGAAQERAEVKVLYCWGRLSGTTVRLVPIDLVLTKQGKWIVRCRLVDERKVRTLSVASIAWACRVGGDGEVFVNPDPVCGPRLVKVADPAAKMRRWAYSIGEAQWQSLGFAHARFSAIKDPHWSWFTHRPRALRFVEGDVFYRGEDFLQVAFSGGGLVEVHEGRVGSGPELVPKGKKVRARLVGVSGGELFDGGDQAEVLTEVVDYSLSDLIGTDRRGWLMPQLSLAVWLATGRRPGGAQPVHRERSSCDGVLRMTLASEDGGGCESEPAAVPDPDDAPGHVKGF